MNNCIFYICITLKYYVSLWMLLHFFVWYVIRICIFRALPLKLVKLKDITKFEPTCCFGVWISKEPRHIYSNLLDDNFLLDFIFWLKFLKRLCCNCKFSHVNTHCCNVNTHCCNVNTNTHFALNYLIIN